MARLTWAKKLNNRLKRNWNLEIDFSKCFIAVACGKRDRKTWSSPTPINDERIRRIYNELLRASKRDSIDVCYLNCYDWNEGWETDRIREVEYYGYYNSYILISVKTPTGRQKLTIDSRHV